ncbi:hypothetical protein ACNFLF_005160, partial [Escherichia coli]
PPVCHCFGVNVTVTATPYFAQIRQNCLPEPGKFARFFDHRVSVSFCTSCCVSFLRKMRTFSGGFSPYKPRHIWLCSAGLCDRFCDRFYDRFAQFFAHFFRDFSPHRRGF